MREEEKIALTLRRVKCFRLMLFAVFGLVFMLSSCEKDELSEGDAAAGPLVPVSINLLGISEGNEEDVTRSSDASFEPVTETVPLGDGMLMEMSLAPDPGLRAGTFPLGEGVKFLLIAVKAGNNRCVSHAEYTIIGGTPTLTGSAAVHVPTGANYRFICVSLNSTTTLPNAYATLETNAVLTFANIPNTVDLLYWSQTVNNVTSDQMLDVTLRHKFNSVKVNVDCSYNGWNISGINADSIRIKTYNTFAMTATGSVSGVTASTRRISWPSSLTPATIQTSRGDTVYLSALDVYLGANALTLPSGSTPSAAETAKFSSASFTEGGAKRYVLTLKIKQPMFASSNIYWDGTKLTFDGYMPNPASQHKYQGVFFRFGSLVGISPARTDGSILFNATSTPLYVPRVSKPSPLATDTFYISSANNTGISHADQWTGTDWTAIPFVGGGTSTDRNNRYVIDMKVDSFTVMKGDICRYLEFIGAAPPRPASPAGLHWSLPISAEFGPSDAEIIWNTTTATKGWLKVGTLTTALSPDKADGTYLINVGGKFGATQNFFPASGFRNAALSNVGINGYHWSGSVNDALGYYLRFLNGNVNPYDSTTRQNGWSVRCVLRE